MARIFLYLFNETMSISHDQILSALSQNLPPYLIIDGGKIWFQIEETISLALVTIETQMDCEHRDFSQCCQFFSLKVKHFGDITTNSYKLNCLTNFLVCQVHLYDYVDFPFCRVPSVRDKSFLIFPEWNAMTVRRGSHLPFLSPSPFNALCEQYHINSFNLSLNGQKTGPRNVKCEQGFKLVTHRHFNVHIPVSRAEKRVHVWETSKSCIHMNFDR